MTFHRALASVFLLTVALPLPAAAQIFQQTATLSGYVYDAESDEPLPGANVFIANSLLGAATDASGFFVLSGVPFGSQEIVVTHVGYESQTKGVRLTESTTHTLAFRLNAAVYESEGVEVVAARTREEEKDLERLRREHERDLERFRRFFLGISSNADQCEILNPEVLTFSTHEESGTFRAVAREPLRIANRALGYTVLFVLDEFEVREENRDRFIRYGGKVGFSELEPEDDREMRRWEKERERAYLGSERHFLTALTSNRIWEEGFMFLKEHEQTNDYSGVPGSRPSSRYSNVLPEDVLSPGELPFERTLNFPGYVQVIYMKGRPSPQYHEFKQYVAGWQLREEDGSQTSWLALTNGPATITTSGRVTSQYGLTKLGYWYFTRVAEMLPLEYQPPGHEEGLPSFDPLVAMENGREAFDAGQYREAALHWNTVFQLNPAYVAPEQGAVAYWLGEAYRHLEEFELAHQVRLTGLKVMDGQGLFDARLADAYLWSVIRGERTEEYTAAGNAYLSLLEHVDAAADAESPDADLALRHFAQLAFMLPDSLRAELLEVDPGVLSTMQRLRPAEGAGRRIAAWWRARDPFPATSANEDVIQHLQRINYALENFAYSGGPGFDDRGLVYVRYGAPRTRTRISTDFRMAEMRLRQGAVPLPGPMISPMNEFWAYRHIDDQLQYLFIDRGGRYQISSPQDLIPDALQTAYRRSGERTVSSALSSSLGSDARALDRVGDTYAGALIEAWRVIYQDLALHHPTFEEQLQQLEFYDSDQHASGGTATGLGNPTYAASPTGFANGLSGQFASLAHEAAVNRETYAPRVFSPLAGSREYLPVAFRAARFRNDDGTTRTEVYWSHLPGTLTLSGDLREQVLIAVDSLPDRYLIEMAVNTHEADFRTVNTDHLFYSAADLPEGAPAPIQTYRVDPGPPSYHLSLQWNQYLQRTDEAGGEVAPGALLKTGVHRIQDLTALSTAPGTLEMSDLKPVYLSEDNTLALDENGEPAESAVYPFMTLTRNTGIGLFFEVYELAYGENDVSDFTVEYQITRDTGRRRGTQTISASVQYSGGERTAREFIALDLSEFDGEGDLAVEVIVTDNVTGRQVRRPIDFRLTEP